MSLSRHPFLFPVAPNTICAVCSAKSLILQDSWILELQVFISNFLLSNYQLPNTLPLLLHPFGIVLSLFCTASVWYPNTSRRSLWPHLHRNSCVPALSFVFHPSLWQDFVQMFISSPSWHLSSSSSLVVSQSFSNISKTHFSSTRLLSTLAELSCPNICSKGHTLLITSTFNLSVLTVTALI